MEDPDSYPDEWKTGYNCIGGGASAWNIEYLHLDCPECEEAGDTAVQTALEDGVANVSITNGWQLVEYPDGVFMEAKHRAIVEAAA